MHGTPGISRIVAGAALALLAAGTGAQASVIHVNAAATGANDGTTWTDAFTDLQSALPAAHPGDEIWIAAGTYRPAPSAGPRSASYELRIGVAIYGGFVGDESSRDLRDWQTHRVILSGDLNGDDGPDFANTGDNSYHVIVATSIDSTALLDGVTIAHGKADGPGFGAVPQSQDQGSGVNLYYATPQLHNCTLLRNWSFNHGAVNDHGGATYVNCEFRENFSAQFGAGLYVHHDVIAVATGCRFIANTATSDGGGAYSRSVHGATLMNCTFESNVAAQGGGMYHAPDSRNLVTHCTFTDNEAAIGGAGMYSERSSPTIQNSTFVNNEGGAGISDGDGGGGGSGGGGTFSTGGSPVIRDCVFTGNLASFGAGVYMIEDCIGTVTDCIFTDNHAREAGGLYTLASPVEIERCTFIDCSALGGSFSVGGGVSNYFSGASMRDCTFIGNVADLGGGGIYNEGEDPLVIGCRFFGNEAFGETEGWGGGILNSYATVSTVANCVFSGNRAHEGGGIFDLFASNTTTVNCTFTGNVATRNGGGGIHVFWLNANTSIANSVLWDNVPDEISGTPVSVRYSCVAGGFAGDGNIAGDPRFVDAYGPDGVPGTLDDDLRPAGGSPCIDAGANADVPAGLLLDVGGSPRFVDDPFAVDTGAGSPPLVDIGAFERQPCMGDLDGDSDADLSDLTALLAHFGQASGATWHDGDLNSNGGVSLADLVLLLGAFGSTCP